MWKVGKKQPWPEAEKSWPDRGERVEKKTTKYNRYSLLNSYSVPATAVSFTCNYLTEAPTSTTWSQNCPNLQMKSRLRVVCPRPCSWLAEELWLDPIPWTFSQDTNMLSLSLFTATVGTAGSQSHEKRSPLPNAIIFSLSSYRWGGFLSGFSRSNLKQLCHTVLGNKRPASWYEAIWLVTTSWKPESVQMFYCHIGPQTSHMTPFQPKSPFILHAHKPETIVSILSKGSRKSELESPWVLKAQCQGIKTNKYISKRQAHPTTTQGNSSGAWETFG